MSNTDAHRPWRLRQFQDGQIVHDHTRGICREESLHEALTPTHYHQRRHCAKWVAEPSACPGECSCRRAASERESALRALREAQDWIGMIRFQERWAKRVWTCAFTHTTLIHHPERSCAGCDAWESRSSCEVSLPWHEQHWRHSSAAERRSAAKQDRARARTASRALLREWNAEGDSEIEIPVRPHRHSEDWAAG